MSDQCKHCGCTETTPCITEPLGNPCGWADREHTVCTASDCLDTEGFTSVISNWRELSAFCAGNATATGDPSSGVGLLLARWLQSALVAPPDYIVRWHEEKRVVMLDLIGELGVNSLPLRITGTDKHDISVEGDLLAFAAKRIGADSWALSPSLNIPGQLHVFVVLQGVPDPPPWERRIVLAGL